MIPRTALLRQTSDWQTALAGAVTDPAELLTALDLDQALLPAALRAATSFPLRVPWSYIKRMRPGDPNDPLLRQVLPLSEEMLLQAGYGQDPVGDLAAMVAPGVLHKYYGRVLLTVTGACAVHCRYCFRRHYPYEDANPGGDHWSAALAYIKSDPEITEVILSGGDPLVLNDRRLADLTTRLAAIPHIRRLRIHSRLPVVLPERITDELLAWLADMRPAPVVVIHANHASEIDGDVVRACRRLSYAGATVLNQSVLLRGVNDTVDALAGLSERLFAAGVLPYYLHLLDRVQGAAHFDVLDGEARALYAALAARLPGYLVPRLVREEAGAPGKSIIPAI